MICSEVSLKPRGPVASGDIHKAHLNLSLGSSLGTVLRAHFL